MLQVDELIRRQSLYYMYRVFNGGLDKIYLGVLQRQHVVDFAGSQWSGNLISLRGALMRIREFWDHLPSDDIPSLAPSSSRRMKLPSSQRTSRCGTF